MGKPRRRFSGSHPALAERTREPAVHLAVCVPSHDRVHTPWAFDLARMMGRLGGGPVAQGVMDVSLLTIAGTYLHDARNTLVADALKNPKTTHLLFLDSDMRFPWDAPLRLLAHNELLVGCNYSTRKGAVPRPVAFKSIEAPEDRPYERFLFPDEHEAPLVEADAVGFGCTLLHAEVLRRMSFPWFDISYKGNTGGLTGEDVYFCRKAREELGVVTKVDTRLSRELGHIGDHEYTLEHVAMIADDAYGPRAPLFVPA